FAQAPCCELAAPGARAAVLGSVRLSDLSSRPVNLWNPQILDRVQLGLENLAGEHNLPVLSRFASVQPQAAFPVENSLTAVLDADAIDLDAVRGICGQCNFVPEIRGNVVLEPVTEIVDIPGQHSRLGELSVAPQELHAFVEAKVHPDVVRFAG